MEIYRSRIADLTDKLSKSVSNRSAGVDYLTFTTGELRDGKRVAFLALFFAIAVDALVLVFTFLGTDAAAKYDKGSDLNAAVQRGAPENVCRFPGCKRCPRHIQAIELPTPQSNVQLP